MKCIKSKIAMILTCDEAKLDIILYLTHLLPPGMGRSKRLRVGASSNEAFLGVDRPQPIR